MTLTCELEAHVCFTMEKMNVIFTSAQLRSIGVHGDQWPLLTVDCRDAVCLPGTRAGVCRSLGCCRPQECVSSHVTYRSCSGPVHISLCWDNMTICHWTLQEARANKGRDSEQNESPRRPCPLTLCFKFPHLLMRTLVHAQCALLLSWQLHSPFAIGRLHVARTFVWLND